MSRHSYDVAVALRLAQECPVIVAPWRDLGAESNVDKELSVIRLKRLNSSRIFDSYLRSVMIFFFAGFHYCLRHKVKLVLANTWSVAGVAAFFINKVFGVPYIVFVHGLDVYAPQGNKKVSRFMDLVLKNASFIIANSSFTKSLLRNIVQESKVVVLHPVVDMGRFTQSSEHVKKIPSEKKMILTVGRLVESKGHSAVIRALPKVLKQFPEVVYQIIGAGPMEKPLKELVNTLGLSGKVIFAGEVKDRELPLYYNACDIFILTSKEIPDKGEIEGFGIVFLEAACFAKPVIGGKSAGIPDAVIDGVTGILVDPENTEEIAAAIVRLLADEAMAKKLGENARKRVLSEFTPGKFSERLKVIIDEAVVDRQ